MNDKMFQQAKDLKDVIVEVERVLEEVNKSTRVALKVGSSTSSGLETPIRAMEEIYDEERMHVKKKEKDESEKDFVQNGKDNVAKIIATRGREFVDNLKTDLERYLSDLNQQFKDLK